ncbi:MAG: cell division protein FtsZ [Bacteroidota bacterium]|nr:cell division protein FtsZ [Bacteroidota bacterium]
METNFEFQMPKNQSSVIKVLGVGGGGSNAVNYMFENGIKGVDFVVCNTDSQALEASPVPVKIQLGVDLTEGLGAGSNPETGEKAAQESIDKVSELLDSNTKMLFITAGMGGGTGTGAAPVIAEAAREKGILTVGVVTNPFSTEGGYRKQYAKEGLEKLRKYVDTLLIINNDKLIEVYGDLTLSQAFGKANEVLNTATKGIAEVISQHLLVNIDLNDARKVLENSGTAVMGQAESRGENRAVEAVIGALDSPLLNDNDISGAQQVLLKIVTGSGDDEIKMSELDKIKNKIQEAAGNNVNIIEGVGIDSELTDSVSVTVIATGFKQKRIKDPVTVNLAADQELEDINLMEEVVNEDIQNIQQDIFDIKNENSNQEHDVSNTEDHELNENKNTDTKKDNEITTKVVLDIEDNISSPSDFITSVKEDDLQEHNEDVNHNNEIIDTLIEPNILNNNLDEEVTVNDAEKDSQVPLQEENQKFLEEDMVIDTQEAFINPDNLKIKAREREDRLRSISKKLRTPSGLSDLEDEPAYKRDNVELKDVPHSSEIEISKLTLTEGDNNKVELRSNNSFLHDNVD